MQNLKKILESRLKSAERVAVIGIGSEFRGDDVAGLLVVRQLAKSRRKKKGAPELRTFNGATAPENITGEVKKFRPTHIVLVDSADIGQNPGDVAFIEEREAGDASFSTHRLPARLTLQYLREFLHCVTFVIGIRPKTLDFFIPPSKEIIESAKQVSKTIIDVVYA
jgi:hydrogenase 3 maturation protease